MNGVYENPGHKTYFPISGKIEYIFYQSCNITTNTFVKPFKPTIMRKVLKSRVILVALATVVALSMFSFVAYTKTKKVCMNATERCQPPAESSEMLWDVLSRQFVSAVVSR